MASAGFYNFFGSNSTNPYFSQTYNSLHDQYNNILVEKHYIPQHIYQSLYLNQSHHNNLQHPIYSNSSSNVFSYFNDPQFAPNNPPVTPATSTPATATHTASTTTTTSRIQNPLRDPSPQFSNIIDLLFTIPLTPRTPTNDTLITVDILSKNTTIFIYNSESVDTCAVCLDTIRNNTIVRKLNACNHLFHINCIDRWVANNNKCPLCRSDINVAPRETDANDDTIEL
jgi:hypothetical protein